MQSAKKFFTENSRLISPQSDPVAYNKNSGMIVMAEQLDSIQHQLKKLADQLASLERKLPR